MHFSEERSSMIRPRLVLATFGLLTFGAATGAYAADLASVLLAQSASIQRGPGLYLNLFKFVPVVLIYLLWAWTTYWVDDPVATPAPLP